MTPGLLAYKLAYEISPIFFVGGVASGVPGQILPIVAFTESASFIAQQLGGTVETDLNAFFAHFEPMPGSLLANNELGRYPFANQSVAANAIIAQPLTISLIMKAPVKGVDGYAERTATMTILQQVMAKHSAQGGAYSVATPAYLYTNCILKAVRDISTGESKQKQFMYQFDFEQPLITLSAAQAANSTLISKIAAGIKT